MKFNKEEVSLCKQIAEKHKKERLELGDWYLLKLLHGKEQIRLYGNQKPWIILTKDFIPLWTISDCLEFLKSRSFYGSISNVGSYYETYYKRIIVGENDEDLSKKVYSGIVKTPLEACLKAVLVVLEEKE